MKQTNKRFISMLLALAFLVGSFVVYFSLIQPVFSEVRKLRNEQFSKQQVLEEQRQVVSELQSLVSEYKSRGEFVELLSFVLPDEDNITTALVQLHSLAVNTRLSVDGVGYLGSRTERQQKRPAATSSTLVLVERPIGTLSFDVQVSGTYTDFKDFLRAIEGNVRLFDVQTLSVKPNYGSVTNPGVNNYTVKVTTYYQGTTTGR